MSKTTKRVICRRCTGVGHIQKTCHLQRITANGETKSIHEWAAALGMSLQGLLKRIDGGMPPEEAVTRPRGWRKGKAE